MSVRLLLLAFISVLFFSQCATHNPQYQRNARDWKAESQKLQPASRGPNANPLVHSMYLLGDAGYSPMGKVAPAVRLLGNKLRIADKNSSLVILGDNIYPDGLRPKDHPEYAQDTHSLNVQLDIIKKFKGKPYIIPGNHDWRYDGRQAVLRQQKYVHKYLGRDDIFYPQDACSGPEKEKLDDSIVLLLIDTQWWIANWDEDPLMNEKCDAKSKTVFLTHFHDMLKKNRDKTVIVALHHPMNTSGSHGGQYSLKDHIFPFTQVQKDLYIPLPGVGTVLNQIRSNIGVRQDVNYPPLFELRQSILNKAKEFDNVIFVSGHDHNLQLIEDVHPFIVSGSGSKESPARAGGNATFTYGSNGFAQLDFYENGEVWARFWATKEGADEAALLFEKRILEAPEHVQEFDFTEYEARKDSVTMTLYDPEELEKGGIHRLLWGNLHRDVYGVPVTVPVLDLDTIYGGLKVVRKGGGNQTHSLRLEAEDGRQYVMRSMEKDAGRILGGVLRGTFVVELMRDVFTFSHPYAAFVVPGLASAAGIYHTNPKLYYVPKQPALGKYNKNFGGGLYLFEERPDDDRSDVASFGRSKEIISTPDVIQNLRDNHKHKIDQPFVLRSRLFDMVIGDWDRHEDQWRWAGFPGKEKGQTIYRPIPRDRDQPFSKFDGLIPNFLNRTVPLTRNMQSFDKDIRTIRWYNNYARHFDRVFLNELDWEVWEKQVAHLQANLTDDVIENAIKQWPPSVYAKSGEDVISKIKGRRDGLLEIAKGYYEVLAKEVDVVGTNKDDGFEVIRLNDDQTRVRVYDLDDGERDKLMYERIFNRKETKEIHLYGLDEEDEFDIEGDVKKGILIRIVGGRDKDKVHENSSVSSWRKKTKVYDSKKGNKLKLGKEGLDRTSDRYLYNVYDHQDRNIDYRNVLPAIGFNPDDGLYLGGRLTFTRFGFKKPPYSIKHKFDAKYAFATGAFDVGYNGEFTDIFGRWDFGIDGRWFSSQYVVNFFGLGNESQNFERNRTLDFHRVRKGGASVTPAIQYRFRNEGVFKIKGLYQSHFIEETANRFILSEDANIDPRAFDTQFFTGLGVSYHYENYDVKPAPTKGFKFLLDGGWQTNVDEIDQDFFKLESELAIYQRLDYKGNIVLATQVGGTHLFGDFQFFQAAVIGGTNSLRGFRQERFAGRSAFYHSSDLRFRFGNEVSTYVAPLSFGIFGSYDYGRVWFDNESSNTWHQSYGGGIWLSTLGALSISASLHHSEETNRVIVRAGFNF